MVMTIQSPGDEMYFMVEESLANEMSGNGWINAVGGVCPHWGLCGGFSVIGVE